jgi:hypothetical protein
MKKLAFIAYSFPPVTTGSAPACLALARCLPEGGWTMIPVTAPNPGGMPIDESLPPLLPEDVLRSRVLVADPVVSIFGRPSTAQEPHKRKRGPMKLLRSLARLYFFVPDKAILWARRAGAAAERLAREGEIDLLVSYGPPHSCHLAAMRASARTGIPWVAQFSDLWMYDSLNEWQYVSGLSKRIQRRMEAHLVRKADGIVTTTSMSSGYFRKNYEKCPPLFHVHNGYDPLLDKPAEPPAGVPGERFLLTFTGFFMGTQTPELFLRGMRLYLDSNPKSRLHFQLVGQMRGIHADLPRMLGLESRITVTGQVPRSEALAYQREADALLILVPPFPGSEVKNPSKLSEYLLSRRPILGVCCEGELTGMIRSLEAGYTSDHDPTAICAALAMMETDWSEGRLRSVRDMDRVASLFDMRIACRGLGRFYDSVLGEKRRS